VISIAALGLGSRRLTISRLVLSFLLLLVHVAASVYYCLYSQSNVADASTYYYDPYYWGSQPWGTDTKLVTQLCYVLKVGFNASYLDCFLVFQTFGFAGIMIITRIFDEIELNIGVPKHRGYWALLFLPSVHFWTSAIGKDAPMFFAIALCVWAMLNLRHRYVYFIISLAIMVLFRAHVAFMAAVAVMGASFFGSSTTIGRKLGFMVLALVGIWLTSGAVESSLGIDPTDPSSVSAFLDQQNSTFATMEGTTSVGDASYPVRVLSLLFRPLFFDAHGVMGLIASFENAAIIAAFIYMIVRWRDLAHLARRVPFVRFVLIFAFILLFALTLVYYNVGLGLRERIMAYPMVYAALVALWSVRQKRSLAAAPAPGDRLMANLQANRPLTELRGEGAIR
jgi:hypothetical protein